MLPRVASAHASFCLGSGGIIGGKRPFRFENKWLLVDSFYEMLDGWRKGYSFKGSSCFFLERDLKALKEDLMKWNKESFCNVSLRKSELLAELLMLDCVEENMGLLDSE